MVAFTKLKDETKGVMEVFPSLALATLLLALSAQVRVLTLMYPMGIAMLVYAAGGLDSRRQKIMAGCIGLVVGTLLIPQIVALIMRLLCGRVRFKSSSPCVCSEIWQITWLDPSIVSPTLLFIGLLGAGVSVDVVRYKGPFFCRRRALWVALAGCVCGVEVSRIRFEVPAIVC